MDAWELFSRLPSGSVGAEFDVRDQDGKWLKATVKKVAEGKVLMHYDGWADKYDEWIRQTHRLVFNSNSRSLSFACVLKHSRFRVARAGSISIAKDQPCGFAVGQEVLVCTKLLPAWLRASSHVSNSGDWMSAWVFGIGGVQVRCAWKPDGGPPSLIGAPTSFHSFWFHPAADEIRPLHAAPITSPAKYPAAKAVVSVLLDPMVPLRREHIQRGRFLDVRDSTGKFCPAEISEVDAGRCRVHFIGWEAKWEEVFEVKDMERFAHLGTYSDSGGGVKHGFMVGDSVFLLPPPPSPAAKNQWALDGWVVGKVLEIEHAQIRVRYADGYRWVQLNEIRPHYDAIPSVSGKSSCSICWDAPSVIALVPCGHLCTCKNCAPRVERCPICRAAIASRLHIYSV